MKIGFLYLFESGGYYKIGFSNDPGIRARKLRTGSALPIRIIHILQTPKCRQIEAELHRKFCELRGHGEWFDLRPEDVEYIKSLDADGSPTKPYAPMKQRRLSRSAMERELGSINRALAARKALRTQPTYRND